MGGMLKANGRSIMFACCLMFLFAAVAVALNVRSGNGRLRDSSSKEKSKLIKRVQESPDQPLKIVGNDECPLRLVEASAKEIPGPLFTELTGITTDLETVSSVPQAKLINISGQTVTGFILVIRDPKSRNTRALIQSKIALEPGETYTVEREHFGAPEKVTLAGENGQVRQSLVPLGMDSGKKWIEFAARADLFVTVGKVDFGDGSSWIIREGGEVK